MTQKLKGKWRKAISPPDQMLAIPWRCLFLAAYTVWAKPGCRPGRQSRSRKSSAEKRLSRNRAEF